MFGWLWNALDCLRSDVTREQAIDLASKFLESKGTLISTQPVSPVKGKDVAWFEKTERPGNRWYVWFRYALPDGVIQCPEPLILVFVDHRTGKAESSEPFL